MSKQIYFSIHSKRIYDFDGDTMWQFDYQKNSGGFIQFLGIIDEIHLEETYLNGKLNTRENNGYNII